MFLLERESQDASGKWNDMNVMYLTSSNGILEANIFSDCNNILKIQWSIENWYTQNTKHKTHTTHTKRTYII